MILVREEGIYEHVLYRMACTALQHPLAYLHQAYPGRATGPDMLVITDHFGGRQPFIAMYEQ